MAKYIHIEYAFYFNCKHVLCIHCKIKTTSKIRGFYKKSKTLNTEFGKKQTFENSIINKHSLGSRKVPH